MTSLAALQNSFLSAVFDSNVSEHLDFIQPIAKVDAAAQFKIYKNNVFSQLTKTLKNIYPACYQLVGIDFFNAMAVYYIRENPSVFVDLNEYGETFAEFISAFEAAKPLPYLADVAKLEWAWHLIYSAANSPVFLFEKFVERLQQAPEDIIFLLPPSSTLLLSTFPVFDIWETNRKNSNKEIVLHPNHVYYYFVWRKDFEPRIDCLTRVEFELLHCIQKRFSLANICALHPSLSLENSLPDLLAKGWIANYL
jgi:hypothetical protein